MRVLMLTWEYRPNIQGGLGRHVTALSRALARAGCGVVVATPGKAGDPEFEIDEGVEVRRVVDGGPWPMSFVERVAQVNAGLMQAVLQAATASRIDLVHAHDWLVASAAKAVKHGLLIPLIATIHATEYGRNGGLHTPLQRHISDVEWWLTYEAWRVICCSAAMRAELGEVFQLPADKIRIVPNGVEPVIKSSREEPERPSCPVVFYIGRLVYEKGVDLLISAFAKTLSRHRNAELLIAGAGPEEGALRRLAERLGILPSVRFLGHISDAERNRLYRMADAAVVPSRYEPFGIVALEAMSQGAPLIAARTGGLAEVVLDRRTGLLFRAGDADDLARCIDELLRSPDQRARFRAAGRLHVEARYTWRRAAEMTYRIYRELIESRPGVEST